MQLFSLAGLTKHDKGSHVRKCRGDRTEKSFGSEHIRQSGREFSNKSI